MKKTVTFTILFILAAATAMAQLAGGNIKIRDFRADELGEAACIQFTAEIGPKAVKRNHSFVFIPVIVNGEYRQSLSPVVIQGKGSQIARERREWVAEQTVGYDNALYAGNGQSLSVINSVPWQEWMSGADLIFESVEGGCCTYNKQDDILLAENILERPEPQPVVPIVDTPPVWVPLSLADSLSTAFTFVVPASEFDENEPFKVYDDERESSLVVYYRVAKYDIDPAYMDNAHTLSNLTAAINMIMASDNSRVNKIVVAGFASPEGSFEFNDRLAFERAVTVKKYLMDATGARDEQIMVFNGSVDWRGLRAMVARSGLPEKRQILSIIDNTPLRSNGQQSGRLDELKRLNDGKTYTYLLNEYFPYLRNGAFIRVYYENE